MDETIIDDLHAACYLCREGGQLLYISSLSLEPTTIAYFIFLGYVAMSIACLSPIDYLHFSFIVRDDIASTICIHIIDQPLIKSFE